MTMNDGAKATLQGLGSFDGKTHILPVSIYYEDTDLSGFVYHANYLRYMERGRTEFFRMAGISRARLEDDEPTAWTLRRIAVEYFRPARLDDRVAVHSVLTEVSGARIKVLRRITITAAQLGTNEMAELRIEVDRTFTPAKLPTGGTDTRELGLRVYHHFIEAK